MDKEKSIKLIRLTLDNLKKDYDSLLQTAKYHRKREQYYLDQIENFDKEDMDRAIELIRVDKRKVDDLIVETNRLLDQYTEILKVLMGNG